MSDNRRFQYQLITVIKPTPLSRFILVHDFKNPCISLYKIKPINIPHRKVFLYHKKIFLSKFQPDSMLPFFSTAKSCLLDLQPISLIVTPLTEMTISFQKRQKNSGHFARKCVKQIFQGIIFKSWYFCLLNCSPTKLNLCCSN